MPQTTDKPNIRTDNWWGQHLWQITPLQDLFWLSLAIFVLWLGYVLRSVFIPMLIAFTAAYAVNPLLQYAEQRWKFRRTILIGGSLATLAISTVVVTLLFGPQLVTESNQLISRAPRYFDTVTKTLSDKVSASWMDGMVKQVGSLPTDSVGLTEAMLTHSGEAFGIVGDVIGTATYLLASAVLIPVYFAYFAWNFNPLLQRMQGWIPKPNRKAVMDLATRMDSAVGNFIRGRLVVVAAMMIMFSVGFSIAGVPYWFLIGCATGILSFVPYLAVVGCGVAVLMTWVDSSSGGSEATAMAIVGWPVAAYCVVQLLEGWLLTPWIQSQSMQMSAGTVLIVLMIGGSLAGVYGLLLAIPITGCIKIVIEDLLAPKLDKWAADAAAS